MSPIPVLGPPQDSSYSPSAHPRTRQVRSAMSADSASSSLRDTCIPSDMLPTALLYATFQCPNLGTHAVAESVLVPPISGDHLVRSYRRRLGWDRGGQEPG